MSMRNLRPGVFGANSCREPPALPGLGRPRAGGYGWRIQAVSLMSNYFQPASADLFHEIAGAIGESAVFIADQEACSLNTFFHW
jgi:hypothetical protein